MSIEHLEIDNFLVFKNKFSIDFCPGINVIIGENGIGKTSLLKIMYGLCNISTSSIVKGKQVEINEPCLLKSYFTQIDGHTNPKSSLDGKLTIWANGNKLSALVDSRLLSESIKLPYPEEVRQWCLADLVSVFIPEKDVISNSRGLPETYKYGKAQFTRTEIDIIEKARILPSSPEQPLYTKICKEIAAEPENDGENFYMKRKELESRIPFSMEASGYRKLGLLAILIRNEQIRPGSILFWDEPENSLSSEMFSRLMAILLKLSRYNIQIFISTHSQKTLKSYLQSNEQKTDNVKFHNLYREGGKIELRNEMPLKMSPLFFKEETN